MDNSEIAASVDDEVFVGPVTLHEMKLRLKSKYLCPTTLRRHTITDFREAAAMKHLIVPKKYPTIYTEDDFNLNVSNEVSQNQEEITIITISDESDVDGRIIVLDSDDDVSVCKEENKVTESCSNLKELNGDFSSEKSILNVSVEEINISNSSCSSAEYSCQATFQHSDLSQSVSRVSKHLFNTDDTEIENQEFASTFSFNSDCCDSDNINHENCADSHLEELSKVDSFISDNYQNDKFSTDPETYDKFISGEEEPKKDKKDSLFTSVKQKTPMAPPPPKPPQSHSAKKLPQKIASTPTSVKNAAFKNIVSPVAVYINSKTIPPIQKITLKPGKCLNVEPATSNTNKVASLDELPKIIYRSAELTIADENKSVQLPPSIKKMCPQLPSVKSHKAKAVCEDIDVSRELKRADISKI